MDNIVQLLYNLRSAMKADLILRLIESHCSGSEDLFMNALNNLADDEDKKGNLALAQSIRQAYSSDKRRNMPFSYSSPMSEMTFSPQNVLSLPKDKDSSLELVEVLQPKVNLGDVSLPPMITKLLYQIIEEQKKAGELLSKGIIPTNRLLFCGPPGCGKTMTANALSNEIGIPVAYVKLDGLVSSFLGQTGSNIRRIFDFVKNKRIMLFLDEFDAIAKKRDDAHELGELKRVVTTLLQNMDAMPANVFLVAATNHHHLLDPAIWRRFNSTILLDSPDTDQRESIIERFMQNILPEYSAEIKTIVTLTETMSGAQICNYLQALARYIIMNEKKGEITKEDIIAVWLHQSAIFSSEGTESFDNALYELSKMGIPIRKLAEVTGIPKSTLNYRKNRKEVKNEQRTVSASVDN
jgi:SpoVK/Ycf46/Vps4 family AAA+-type ATPase